MTLRTPICDLFGIEKPVFLAGMGGVAYARVCAAVSEAGGFGTLGMASEASRADPRGDAPGARARPHKPFGVDLLAALPETIERADRRDHRGRRVGVHRGPRRAGDR